MNNKTECATDINKKKWASMNAMMSMNVHKNNKINNWNSYLNDCYFFHTKILKSIDVQIKYYQTKGIHDIDENEKTQNLPQN